VLDRDDAALDAWGRACRPDKGEGDGIACYNLGSVLERFRHDHTGAARAFAEGCRLSDATACVLDAAFRFASDGPGAEKTFRMASADATHECETNPETCLALSDWYRASHDAKLEAEFRDKARAGLRRQCDSGDAGACRILGVM
jgi:TPR repeat protein